MQYKTKQIGGIKMKEINPESEVIKNQNLSLDLTFARYANEKHEELKNKVIKFKETIKIIKRNKRKTKTNKNTKKINNCRSYVTCNVINISRKHK